MPGDNTQRMFSIVGSKFSSRTFKYLSELRKLSIFTDITLKVGDDELQVHKLVLSANSPFFAAMFTGAFLESKEDKIVLLHDTNVAVMTAVLDYMYSGELTIASNQIGLLLRNFDYFQMENAKLECVEYLEKSADTGNCLDLLFFAKESASDKMSEIVSKLILDNFGSKVFDEKIKQLSKSQLEDFLDLVYHQDADVACQSILLWISHDKCNRSEYIGSLLTKYVSIKHLSKDLVAIQVPRYLLNSVVLARTEAGKTWLGTECLDLNPDQPNLFILNGEANNCGIFQYHIQRNTIFDSKLPPLFRSSSIIKYRGKIYIFGSNKNFIYDINQKCYTESTWEINAGSSALCVDGYNMYFAGGFQANIFPLQPSKTFICYNIATNEKITLPDMEFARYSPALVSYGSSLYVFGGYSSKLSGESIAIVERYDPREGMWHNAGQISSQAGYCTAGKVSELIYLNDGGLFQSFDPRCSKSEIYETSDVATIASYRNTLYKADESGIYEFVEQRNWNCLYKEELLLPIVTA